MIFDIVDTLAYRARMAKMGVPGNRVPFAGAIRKLGITAAIPRHALAEMTIAINGKVKSATGEVFPVKDSIEVTDFDARLHDPSHSRVMFCRRGGFGDILFLTPLMRYLKQRYEGVKVDVFCNETHFSIFDNNIIPVDTLLPNPFLSPSYIKRLDFVTNFVGTIESSCDATPAVDVFAAAMGIDDLSDKLPIYATLPELDKKAAALYARLNPEGKPSAAIHLKASSALRTYPPFHSLRVAADLVKRGWITYFIGTARDWLEVTGGSEQVIDVPGIHNLCGEFKSINASVSFIKQCDILIAPDSGLLHYAGALRHPSIGLYGPFPAAARTSYYENHISLEGDYNGCQYCFKHFKEGCDHEVMGWSGCLFNLKPKEVVNATEKLYEETAGQARAETSDNAETRNTAAALAVV